MGNGGQKQMIEWLVFPAMLAGVAFIPKSKNEKGKIETIFKNTGYGVKGKEGKLSTPKFKKSLPITDGEETIGTRYLYSIPLGLPATKLAEMEKNIGIFSDGLGRPVIVEFKASLKNDFKKYLTISVFDKELPSMFPYMKLPKKKGWVIPLGRSLESTLWHNFDHVPHMTVAGTTRFGKTVFLKVLMTYLIENHPDDVEFYIIDLKGGLEFGRYERLEQVKAVASNPVEALEILDGIHEEMQKAYLFFRSHHYSNIVDTPIKKRKFIIVDEAAQLAPEKWMDKKMKDMLGACQWLLGEVSRIGGALGYRVIFATQYPTSDTLPRSIKMNADGKVTFRLPSGYASDVAIDDRGAESLPSDVKGRALYKTHELREMQVPYLSNDEMWERLEHYQIPQLMKGEAENVVEYREKTNENRKDTEQNRPAEVRNQGTHTDLVRFGKGQKRAKSTKGNG